MHQTDKYVSGVYEMRLLRKKLMLFFQFKFAETD